MNMYASAALYSDIPPEAGNIWKFQKFQHGNPQKPMGGSTVPVYKIGITEVKFGKKVQSFVL